MSLAQLERIAAGLGRAHPVAAAPLTHRLGFVPAGEASLHVAVWAAHRAEALEFVRLLVERLKADVPVWKRVPPAASSGARSEA